MSSIHAWLGRTGNEVQVLERSEVGKVEDRAKVHVEPLGALSGENSPTTRKLLDGGPG